jgi:hypothetical protein
MPREARSLCEDNMYDVRWCFDEEIESFEDSIC